MFLSKIKDIFPTLNKIISKIQGFPGFKVGARLNMSEI